VIRDGPFLPSLGVMTEEQGRSRRWVTLTLIVLGIVALVVVVAMMIGGGGHDGPARHFSGPFDAFEALGVW
jgi:hypothetical protein